MAKVNCHQNTARSVVAAVVAKVTCCSGKTQAEVEVATTDSEEADPAGGEAQRKVCQ
jgi:hypothetical protein